MVRIHDRPCARVGELRARLPDPSESLSRPGWATNAPDIRQHAQHPCSSIPRSGHCLSYTLQHGTTRDAHRIPFGTGGQTAGQEVVAEDCGVGLTKAGRTVGPVPGHFRLYLRIGPSGPSQANRWHSGAASWPQGPRTHPGTRGAVI